MNPNTGELYESLEAARAAGVENPVELSGEFKDVKNISELVAKDYRRTHDARGYYYGETPNRADRRKIERSWRRKS